jgi:hypothetical protein
MGDCHGLVHGGVVVGIVNEKNGMNGFLIGVVFSLSCTNVTIPSFSFFWMMMTFLRKLKILS